MRDIEKCSQSLIILIKKRLVLTEHRGQLANVVINTLTTQQHVSEDVEQYHCIFLRIFVFLVTEDVQHQWNIVLRLNKIPDDLYDLLYLFSRVGYVLGLLGYPDQRF